MDSAYLTAQQIYEVQRKGFDFTLAPNPKVRAGVLDQHTVNLGQLNSKVAEAQDALEVAIQQNRTDWTGEAALLQQRIDGLLKGVVGWVNTGGIVESVAAAAAAAEITGVDATADESDWHRWFLVFDESSPNPAETGIYLKNASGVVRVPEYDQITEITAGYEIFVDSLDRKFMVIGDPVPVSATNDRVAELPVLPRSRLEEIQVTNPIKKAGLNLYLDYDAWFAINENGQLSAGQLLSDRFVGIDDQVAQIISDLQNQQGSIDALNQTTLDLVDGQAVNTQQIAQQGTRLTTVEGDLAGKIGNAELQTGLEGLVKTFKLGKPKSQTFNLDGVNYNAISYQFPTGFGNQDYTFFVEGAEPFLKKQVGVEDLLIAYLWDSSATIPTSLNVKVTAIKSLANSFSQIDMAASEPVVINWPETQNAPYNATGSYQGAPNPELKPTQGGSTLTYTLGSETRTLNNIIWYSLNIAELGWYLTYLQQGQTSTSQVVGVDNVILTIPA